MLFGRCNSICMRYLPLVLLGGDPTYYYNVSLMLENSGEPVMQSIEEKGCHTVFNDAYEISTSGIIHAAWVRNKHGQMNPKHDETIYYRDNRNGSKWEVPIELYSVKDTETQRHFRHLSLASSSNSAFILWLDVKKGIYFSEIRNGRKENPVMIGGLKRSNLWEEPLWFASTIKVASDNDGNAYAVWSQNFDHHYQLFFRARIKGKWTNEINLKEGAGYLKLPDMKVDRQGTVHITYIRSTDPREPYGKYGCYYIKLKRMATEGENIEAKGSDQG
jgi:hypothetical protein